MDMVQKHQTKVLKAKKCDPYKNDKIKKCKNVIHVLLFIKIPCIEGEAFPFRHLYV